MDDRYFQVQLVNGLQGDPAVHLHMKNSAEALLFDLGSIDELTPKELLRIRHAFVSHAHMDHFAGFDRWLRIHVPHKRLLTIVGPAPFFERVQAKLRSYMWNLIDPDQTRFQVYEVSREGSAKAALLSNSQDFAVQNVQDFPENSIALSDGSQVTWTALDHNGTISLAYKISAPEKLKVKTESFSTLGLKPGSWVGQLQFLFRQGQLEESILIEGQSYKVADLSKQLLERQSGQALIYCTDFSFDSHNIQQLTEDLQSATDMVCETNYSEEHRPRALANAHLTTRQAALLSVRLKVTSHTVFHISGIYGADPSRVVDEFQNFRQTFLVMDDQALQSEFDQELAAIAWIRSQALDGEELDYT